MRSLHPILLIVPALLAFFSCSSAKPSSQTTERGAGGRGSGVSAVGGLGQTGAGGFVGGSAGGGATSSSGGSMEPSTGGGANPPSGGANSAGGRPSVGGATEPGAGGGAGVGGTNSGGGTNAATGFYQLEALDRGVVAVVEGDGVYVGWRLLGYDDENVAFNVYRDGALVNSAPLAGATNYFDSDGAGGSQYSVTAVVGDSEGVPSAPISVWAQNYLEIPVSLPAGAYSPNDASVGDLDGDGDYEIIVKIYPDNAQDNSNSGMTDNTYIDAYDTAGTRLWRIDLGRNIRSGAHYSPFLVYDFDGDGRSELMVKTAEGTVDGEGKNVLLPGDNADSDHRNSGGYILAGPEYLTVFDGLTGAEVDTVAYNPERGNVDDWGDDYGNRVDRFLAAVILGEEGTPLAMFSRGYYTRTVLAAWKLEQGALSLAWVGDSENGGDLQGGQGAHSLSVANVDDDPAQEIIFGAMTVDHDGTLKCTTGFGHGDALHVSAFIAGQGQVAMIPHESGDSIAATMRDAGTCEILWRGSDNGGSEGPGRAVCADIDPASPGAECWWGAGTFSAADSVGAQNTGEMSTTETPTSSTNFVISWDADLARELLNGNSISSPDGNGPGLVASGCSSNNGTKSTPNLTADILGDWREEVIFRCGNSLRIYTTTDVAENRMYTLMHDPQYRMAVAWQNAGYNQPPHTSFYMGEAMAPAPRPDMHTP